MDLGSRRLLRAEALLSDAEIVGALRGVAVLAVDSPLSEPRGGAMRAVDREMIRRGFRVLPPSWRPMSQLTRRALALVREIGSPAIETHPRSALRSSGCGDVGELLDAMGISHGELPRSRDALDAVVAAAVAAEAVEGRALEVRAEDGSIYLCPRECTRGSAWRTPGLSGPSTLLTRGPWGPWPRPWSRWRAPCSRP